MHRNHEVIVVSSEGGGVLQPTPSQLAQGLRMCREDDSGMRRANDWDEKVGYRLISPHNRTHRYGPYPSGYRQAHPVQDQIAVLQGLERDFVALRDGKAINWELNAIIRILSA